MASSNERTGTDGIKRTGVDTTRTGQDRNRKLKTYRNAVWQHLELVGVLGVEAEALARTRSTSATGSLIRRRL